MDSILEVAEWVRKHYGKPVKLRIDTNGHGCLLNESRDVFPELKKAGIAKISVSLNAHNGELYNQVCRPRPESAFEHVLDFIGKAREHFEVEVTAVAIPEVDRSEITL